jgi:hypothetical protein
MKKKTTRKQELLIENQTSNHNQLNTLINEKICYIQEIIQNTVLSIQTYKSFEIFSNSDVNMCITTLKDLYEQSNVVKEENTKPNMNVEILIETLQKIIDKLGLIISNYGTYHIEDLIYVNFGLEFKNKHIDDPILQSKYDIIKKYVHPIGYKLIHWKSSVNTYEKRPNTHYCENKITDETMILECYNHLECVDIDTNKGYMGRIHGIRLIIQNEQSKKTLIIPCMVDNIITDFLDNKYIEYRKKSILENIPNSETFDIGLIKRILDTMTMKDMLVYGNNDIYKRQINIYTDVNFIKYNKLDVSIKKFLDLDMFNQRNMLINLLTHYNDDNIQYITYLLYDLLNVNANETDSIQQKYIYDSFPFKVKNYFKDAMKITIKYSQDMVSKYDINKITLEQQIFLMKAPENVREKAMVKLKEIKCKSDDASTKAKQYLEGLLKIPFNTYKQEPILKIMKNINKKFASMVEKNNKYIGNSYILNGTKPSYTCIEIQNIITTLYHTILPELNSSIMHSLNNANCKQLNNIIQYLQRNNIGTEDIHSILKQPKKEKHQFIADMIGNMKDSHIDQIDHICKVYDFVFENDKNSISKIPAEVKEIETGITSINTTIESINAILDESIYGHTTAKNQILKIIGQWITGEQTGYCFGFEGSPGVGKTSLAKKGLSKCLVDEDGESRPFSFIALGGSCNGSTLEGHSYTYVNSTWGRIVDILMETKCMNPIIYIDELDKVSKTEHGKEIIGILTHLVDPAQNDVFQDKFYSGINIDLSKALFIFSYNDPDQIDKILLDRIHRIKFDNLTMTDKLVIVEKHILPEINKKMGFHNTVQLEKDVIEFIINHYTLEPGVRKLKEILFDLFGEINIRILKGNEKEIPVKVTVENIEKEYLKQYNKVEEKKVNTVSKVGVINGLWANALGKGGIIPIEVAFVPSNSFMELKLTGMQGDVMKESMNVAKSLAWNLTPSETRSVISETYKTSGLHIHCPEGAVSKDGPSAGTAITISIYSILNNIKIKNDVAITGEINLQGDVTAIGGLEMKILGGIRAGVKTFIFPDENAKDYDKINNKYKDTHIMDNIQFISVKTIQDVFKYVFEEDI